MAGSVNNENHKLTKSVLYVNRAQCYIGGSVIAADCGVQSPYILAVGCHYLCCAT